MDYLYFCKYLKKKNLKYIFNDLNYYFFLVENLKGIV
jgi:hypothetical protein